MKTNTLCFWIGVTLGTASGIIVATALWQGTNFASYQAGLWTGKHQAEARIEEIISARRVYLSPLRMNGDYQTVSNCIFLQAQDPNFPGLIVGGSHVGITIENSEVDMTRDWSHWMLVPVEEPNNTHNHTLRTP